MSLGIIDPIYGSNGPENRRDDPADGDDEPRPRMLASDLALDRIRMSRVAGHIEMMVIAGSGASRIEHRIHAVSRVTLAKPTDGLDPSLRIESATGHITLIEVAKPPSGLPNARGSSAGVAIDAPRPGSRASSSSGYAPIAGSDNDR